MILGPDVARLVAGPFLAACALLAIAGAAKVARPAPTRVAARAVGLRVSRPGVVAFGLAEIGAGILGARFGGAGALAVALGYAVLTVFAVRLRSRAPTTPCACLGSADAVVTRAHVVIDAVAAGVALAAVSGGSALARISGRWLAGFVFVILVACCVKLAALVLEVLPEVGGSIGEATP